MQQERPKGIDGGPRAFSPIPWMCRDTAHSGFRHGCHRPRPCPESSWPTRSALASTAYIHTTSCFRTVPRRLFPWTVARRPRCDAYLGVFAWPRPAVQELESIFSTCVSALNLPVCESAMSAYFVFWGSVTRRPYRSSRGPVHTSDGFRSDSRMHGNVAKNLCERATR